MNFASKSCVCIVLASLAAAGCSQPAQQIVTYKVAQRQHAPEPVYSRVTWAHLPQPIKPQVKEHSPYLLPIVEFEMPNGNFGEGVEALAQSMGYRWNYPQKLAGRRIQINKTANVEEILAELCGQVGANGAFDHPNKMLNVLDDAMMPRLP